MSDHTTSRRVWGLVPAAGSGLRFGGSRPKQLLEVRGKPLLTWTLERLLAAGVEGVTVALPEDWLGSVANLHPAGPRVAWVTGGAHRQASVAACLAAAPEDVELVLVHDGARPAVAVADIVATIEAVGEGDGAVLGRPLVDTLKRVQNGRIEATVDRSSLYRIETPQVFWRPVLARALRRAEREGFLGTDEASLVERLGEPRINVAMASHPNPKLTRPQDLAWVDLLLARSGEAV